MAADRNTSATHKRLFTSVHLLLCDHLIDARHLLGLGDHNGAKDDNPAFEASFFACYQARPATEENLSAVMVLDLLQKRTVHFCSRYNTVTGTSAPLRPPSHPPLAPSSLIALLPPLEAGQMVYHTCRKHVVVRAWPRANAIPNRSPSTSMRTCPNYDCTSCSMRSKSISPLRLGMSSMSTSPMVAFPTSAVYNRTWMPTLTPVPKTHELRHAGEVRVGSRPCVAQILAWR